MGRQSQKTERRRRIHRGVRKKVQGTKERPRLSVYRSNRHIYAQLIDDLSGSTIASASSQEADIKADSPVKLSHEVGKALAVRAKEAGIEMAVFDRGGYRYHGRVRALAEGVREGGLTV
ncbi:MAG: 50S ribosomal protein L18 [Rhodothermia bacterium]|nr:50S ribosomal protein L18 [Rhodothermia bacterium]